MHSHGRSPVLIFAALIVAAIWALGCAPETTAPAPGPNLLFVTIDTLRADHTQLLGYKRDTTPHLRVLASEGISFETAYAAMPSTGPSHASMLTGLYPASHGVLWNGMRLDERHETLAEILAAAGYHTAGVVSSFPLSTAWGYAQGFEDYLDDFDAAGATITTYKWNEQAVEGGGFDQRGDQTTSEATRWLDERWDRERPFFLFVHYFDPHAPYQAPAAYLGRFRPQHAGPLTATISLYDQEIFYVDQAIGRLLGHLREMGLDENTLVVVTADHGEGLMQHGHLEHGIHIYEEAVRVPLVFRWSGELAGDRSIAEPVSLVDLVPTVLDLLEVPRHGKTQGRSLATVLRGDEEPSRDRPIFLHRRRYDSKQIGKFLVSGERWAIRRGDWKLIVGETPGSEELFRLSIDGREQTNVASYHPEKVALLRAELEAWRQSAGDHADTRVDLTSDERAALEALGYVE